MSLIWIKKFSSTLAALQARSTIFTTSFAAAFAYVCSACVAGAALASPTTASSRTSDDMAQFLKDRGIMAVQKAENTFSQASQAASSLVDKAGELVVHAMGFIGVPYKLGGNSAENGGLDCSGFVRAVYQQTIGLALPRKAEQQAAATTTIDRTELQPGDLVFFNTLRRTFSHVGIYIGDGRFVHSPRPGGEVRVESMNMSYWKARFNGARRVEALAREPEPAK